MTSPPPPASGHRPHWGLLVALSLVGAVVAAGASALSGELSAGGVAAMAAAGALLMSSLSGLLARDGPSGVWIGLLVVAIGIGGFGLTRYRKEAENAGVIRMTNGCAPFQVFAQNRWLPYGAAIRTGPSVKDKQIAGRDPNQSIMVNGWVHGDVAYSTNPPPWNSDVWFHLADGAGWVSFAGVRATPVAEDPTGLSPEGGQPARALAECQGEAQ